jgi:hypothetical protein
MENRNSKTETGKRQFLPALHAEWRKFSLNLAGPEELDERGLRLWWATEELRKYYRAKGGRFARIDGRTVFIKCDDIVVSSWKGLNKFEARYLVKVMREETGEAAAYRAGLIERIARELWGDGRWGSELIARLHDRFPQVPSPKSLDPSQAHALIEELLSRLARKEIAMAGGEVRWDAVEAKIEQLREKFK